MDCSNIVIGFLGCGKISNAVARGYIGAPGLQRPKKIIVSPRNAEKASALKAEFPDMVEIAGSNEAVVEGSTVVFIGLVPEVAREVLPNMPFTAEHHLISMMAAVNYDEVVSLTRVDPSRLIKTVPLPGAARRSGPILSFPPNAYSEAVLNIVGTAVPCTEEKDMKPLISITGHISPFFELMNVTQQWVVEQGLSPESARLYVSAFYSGLASSAAMSTDSFAEMVEEAATPGGLNEQTTAFLRSTEHYNLHRQSLDAVLNRLKG
jgi:pyrroline-5-carboxylate reductase